MPRFRPDLASLPVFRPDKSLDASARDLGVEDLAKLSLNESPSPPFAEVRAAIASAPHMYHRYPDTSRRDLRLALADHLDVPFDHLWVGAGSAELLKYCALAMGGTGTSAVYPDPTFFLFPKFVRLASSEPVPVPVDGDGKVDLVAMRAAIRPDTTLIFLCNPNNPTGAYTARDELWKFIEDVPGDVLVLMDEAYHEYASAVDYRSAISLALERANVVVTRTFSKVYSLAGLRVGYMIGQPATLAAFHKLQTPFTVPDIAQLAAIEALRHQDQVAERLRHNAAGLAQLHEVFTARNIPFVRSQTNFVYCDLGRDRPDLRPEFMRQGVAIARIPTGWYRVNVGTLAENERFVAVLDELP